MILDKLQQVESECAARIRELRGVETSCIEAINAGSAEMKAEEIRSLDAKRREAQQLRRQMQAEYSMAKSLLTKAQRVFTRQAAEAAEAGDKAGDK